MAESFLNGKIQLHCGDCLKVLPTLAENSIDSCVTDPPYHLLSIVKRFGDENAAPPKQRYAYGGNFKEENGGTGAAFVRMSRGFMGKAWDGGDIAFRPEVWAAVYRVLKPGGHLLAMGGTRTFHRLACAIEEAGFEIRDTIGWLYGSGFPKSHDVSKGIDRAAGAEREIVAFDKNRARPNRTGCVLGDVPYDRSDNGATITAPATDAARQWEGWGTALKPAMELICLARKPLSEKTVAANVLRWGTGGINIDGCRVEATDERSGGFGNGKRPWETGDVGNNTVTVGPETGRWPANLAHDGSAEVVAAFPDVHGAGAERDAIREAGVAGMFGLAGGDGHRFGDEGSTARFFYTAKADSDDRLGSKHPTVKPLDLMQWLVRLVTPPQGTVLDPFAGTGTTGEVAWREIMHAVLIEREPEYQEDIRRRMKLCLAGPDERTRESIKARGQTESPGPLFDALSL